MGGLLFVIINSPVLMFENQYGFKMLFLLSSISGYFIMHHIANKLQNNCYLIWCGRIQLLSM